MSTSQRSPVARVERTSARVALWTALALTALVALLLGRWSRPIPAAGYTRIAPEQALWQGVDFLAFPEVRLLQRYAQIDTSPPEPNEVAGAEFLAAQLAAAGIPAHIERFGDRRANLWAFVEGEDPNAVVLLGHLDVEPALRQEGWLFPPFDAVIDGPWIYGRGMYDMKSLTVAQLLATIDAAGSGRRPKRSLLFLQTSGEETASELGSRWILDEHPELVARMDTVLTEGGVVEAISATDLKYWGIEFAQKQYGRVTFCSADRSALVDFAALLRRTGWSPPRPQIDPSVTRFLSSYAETRGLGLYRRFLAEPERIPLDVNRYWRLTRFLRALFHNRLEPLRVERDADDGYKLDVWIHALPGEDLEAVAAELLPAWKTHGLARSPLERMGDGVPSSVEHPDFATLERVVRERYPGVAVGPFFLVQATTDAQRYRSAGIRTYGFSPFPLTVSETTQIALPNERMQLPAFRTGVELYREAVRQLLR